MSQENNLRIIEGERKIFLVPIAVFTRNGKVFAVREKASSAERYLKNDWFLLQGRAWMGEETGADLTTLASD